MAKANPFRFSTKYTDQETGLLYYGYRYLNVGTGQWYGRDRIGEDGGVNLYNFCNNASINSFDVLGMWSSMHIWLYLDNQHRDLTTKSVNLILDSFSKKPKDKCRKMILNRIIDGNLGQDSGVGSTDFSRHFCRYYFKNETSKDVEMRRELARRGYQLYIGMEENGLVSEKDCSKRLEIMGKLSHALQDYFSHGIHERLGFVDPIPGTPENISEGIWPSSYNEPISWSHGEHENLSEPVSNNSKRYQQAIDYIRKRFQKRSTSG